MNKFELFLQGDSMWPTLKDGQRIQCIFLEKDPELGDIIFFKENDEYIIHRVINLSPLITKGDRTYNYEFPSQIFGIVHSENSFKRTKAYFSKLMLVKNPIRYFALVLLVFLAITTRNRI